MGLKSDNNVVQFPDRANNSKQPNLKNAGFEKLNFPPSFQVPNPASVVPDKEYPVVPVGNPSALSPYLAAAEGVVSAYLNGNPTSGFKVVEIPGGPNSATKVLAAKEGSPIYFGFDPANFKSRSA